jgi:hypothetical protein
MTLELNASDQRGIDVSSVGVVSEPSSVLWLLWSHGWLTQLEPFYVFSTPTLHFRLFEMRLKNLQEPNSCLTRV